jgi:heptosyltransferase-2
MTQDSSKTLVYAPNWLGDSIMAMPAVAALKQSAGAAHITILCNPSLAPLWDYYGPADEVEEVYPGVIGAFSTAERLRPMKLSSAFILPNSFRSAFIPFFAGIRQRIGARGHGRAWMLTRSVTGSPGSSSHQSVESASILGVADQDLELPVLELPSKAIDGSRAKFFGRAGGERLLALVPGAARGSSKQWPKENFIATGRFAAERLNTHCLVLGAETEWELCRDVAAGIGSAATSVAGATTLLEFAACLQLCGVAVTNDSGGMHLAAAAGARVVAIYGITDPAVTGPLGDGHRILQDSDVRSRDVPRESKLAEERLARISPDQAFDAIASLMA